MVDSIEIRLDQLTEAVKGLYAKSGSERAEIYNALTSLAQRYENVTNISSEKIAVTLVNEFRKTIDDKYGQTNLYLKDLETTLKNLLNSQNNQNPQMAQEITKLLNDTSNTYAKLNAQDLALQKIFNLVDQQKGDNAYLEITKLSENFLTFSRGFENITTTLNKNFADFLERIRKNNSKEEILEVKAELDTIGSNINSIISAISIIDTKYKDLTGIVDAIQHRESVFNEAIAEVKNVIRTINSIKNDINSIDPKADIMSLASDVKNQIEAVKYEIQKAVNSTADSGIKTEVYNLSTNVSNVSSNLQNLSTNLTGTKDEIKTLQNVIQNMGVEIKDVRGLINDEILYKSHQTQQDFDKHLNNVKEEIKHLLLGLSVFKKDVASINEGNIKILQEPIEKAMEALKDQDIGKNIKELSENLRDVVFEVQSSIQNVQNSLNDVNSATSLQILTQIQESIPMIADKLEIFRTHVVTENSTNLSNIKTSFLETIAEFKDNLKVATDKIQDDSRTISIETLDTLKVDLQKLSDHLVDSIEVLSDRVDKELANSKVEFQEFAIRQNDSVDKMTDKLSALEVGLENFSNETLEKLNSSISASSAQAQDTLTEIKSDILEGIVESDRATKNVLSQYELKIDKLLDNYIGADLDNIVEKKSLRETVVDIENKIDRTNLQQIHNAKELLEEIQSTTSNLNMKISAIEDNKTLQSIMSVLTKISEKIQTIEETNVELSDGIKDTQEQIEQKLKDNVQKISALVENKPQETVEGDRINTAGIDNLSNKVQEYLSNFEYLKNNISQEIKENLESEFTKIGDAIRKIRSSDENSNYSYTLEDIEADLAKIKLDAGKTYTASENIQYILEKLNELKALTGEATKYNSDISAQFDNLTGWIKDTIAKIDDINIRLDDIQNIGFQDIKTRLVQSEKSKVVMSEFNGKVENALKHIIKYQQANEARVENLNKKLELLSQNQSETFNPSQFIDIFYDNMNQTKMLANRVEIIEDKVNTIQTCVEKLLSYVEQ